MRKKNNYLVLLSFIFAYLATSAPLVYTRSLVMGTIQFPRILKKVPFIRLYYGGKIVNSAIHKGIAKVTFEVSKNNRQNTFYLLVTPHIEYQVKPFAAPWQSNTISYLKLPANQPYKFYRLALQPNALTAMDSREMTKPSSRATEKNNDYYWEVSEEQLPATGKIPDQTIVVCYFPETIFIRKGGSKLELPALVVNQKIIEQMGSEKKLHEESIELLIASLDTDTIHAPTKQEIKQDQQRTLIINHLT